MDGQLGWNTGSALDRHWLTNEESGHKQLSYLVGVSSIVDNCYFAFTDSGLALICHW